MSRKGEDDFLPIPILVEGPQVSEVAATANLSDVMEDDLRYYNYMLAAVSSAWTAAVCVDDVCKLALTTIRILGERRKAMLLPSRGREEAEANYLLPLA